MARQKQYPFRAIFRDDPFGWKKFKNEAKGFGSVGVIHKGPTKEVPHRFSNEIISAEIAKFLRLPIPPFGITRFEGQEKVELKSQVLFSSLDFNFERDVEPLPDFDRCMEVLPHECAGILLFDILVGNPDRTKDNLWCNNPGEPKRLLIYDHDQSLLGGEHDGIERLKALEDELGLCFWSSGGSDFHPFISRISDASTFDEWYNRISSLPDWFINDICESSKELDIGTAESKAIKHFLKYRSRNLETIVNRHRNEFKNIDDWNRGLFK